MTAEPRLLACFGGSAGRGRIKPGTYRVAVGRSAEDLDLSAETTLADALFGS
jgi:beta-glucosidase